MSIAAITQKLLRIVFRTYMCFPGFQIQKKAFYWGPVCLPVTLNDRFLGNVAPSFTSIIVIGSGWDFLKIFPVVNKSSPPIPLFNHIHKISLGSVVKKIIAPSFSAIIIIGSVWIVSKIFPVVNKSSPTIPQFNHNHKVSLGSVVKEIIASSLQQS